MPAKMTPKNAPPPLDARVEAALAALERLATARDRDNLARFAISAGKAFGVSMTNVQKVAKGLGRSHELAAALWATGWYEARLLTAFVEEPERVTPAQMDRWVEEFDNWAVCDTLCFHLFDRHPQAFRKVEQWSRREEEFVKRTAFALLWSLSVHDKESGDDAFLRCLPLVERAAADERNFVKKAVNMALRAVGKRNPALHAEAVAVARRLAASPEAAPRWVGKDALRELTSPKVMASVSRRGGGKP